MTPLVAAEIVDWGALLKVIVVSLVGGVGLTAVFSLAVAGAIAFVDFRREGRPLEAVAFAVVAMAAVVACLAAIAYGLTLMIVN